jgi:hypothetical protein
MSNDYMVCPFCGFGTHMPDLNELDLHYECFQFYGTYEYDCPNCDEPLELELGGSDGNVHSMDNYDKQTNFGDEALAIWVKVEHADVDPTNIYVEFGEDWREDVERRLRDMVYKSTKITIYIDDEDSDAEGEEYGWGKHDEEQAREWQEEFA